MLKIQIKSKETIKPSSPTSPNLPPIQLSSLDHTSPQIYTHILLFYYSTSTTTTITNPLQRLKTSLSSTLTHFFPLAGRIQPSNSDGTLHVHCTDNGAEFIEALAEGDLESFLKTSSRPIDEFPKLLPIKKDQFKLSEALLAVQVTTFDSGGHVLGLSMSHLIADGASMAMFLKEWSAISRGASTSSLPKFYSSSVLFPPHQPWSAPSTSLEKEQYEEGDQVSTVGAIRRFAIDKDGVERLRSSGQEAGWRPTRVEAVSALAWRCLRRAKGDHAWENCGGVSQVVNIRKKMAPRLSDEDFGNLWVDVVVKGEDGRLEEGIREAVRGVDEEYVRRWIEGKEKRPKRERRRSSSSIACNWKLIFTSWCRMEFYKSDFGWGEPDWVGCGLREMKDVCMFIDAKDGQGIDLWVWLDADQMIKFETDPELLHFLSNF